MLTPIRASSYNVCTVTKAASMQMQLARQRQGSPNMKNHPICPICDNPLDYFETSRYGTLLHTTQRYLERCHFALDIGRAGRDAALEKWAAMGGEVAGDDEVDWV